MDEKDRLGDKLQEKRRAEEDLYFKKRDQELVEKLRQSSRTAGEDEVRELARDRCPRCGARLARVKHHGVGVDECPTGHGMWVDQQELETIAQRERDSWVGRYFYRPKSVV